MAEQRRRKCAGCRKQFRVPVRAPRERFCTACRTPVDPAAPVEDGIVAAVRAELQRCGALGSLGGAIALRIAAVLDDPSLPGGQVGTLSAQLQRTMAPILESAPREPDELDAMRQRLAGLTGGAA